MQDKPDLAALIGSRICHDLISPIGAIGNGVELLMMDGAAQTPELALIAESVASADARIRFFRVAYGAASGNQRIARGEVAGIIADMTRGGRLQVEWISSMELSRREVKLASCCCNAWRRLWPTAERCGSRRAKDPGSCRPRRRG